MCEYVFFFFKQKTAYEMRISDWSSDVCSSDLQVHELLHTQRRRRTEWHQTLRRAGLGLGVLADPLGPVAPAQAAVTHPTHAGLDGAGSSKIGRASCREGVCQ